MKNIIGAALIAVMAAGSASAGVSSLQVGGHTVGSLWNKFSVSGTVGTVMTGAAALMAIHYFLNKDYNNS